MRHQSGDHKDIRYNTTEDGIPKIAICRPVVHNAFRPQTLIEISQALTVARDSPARHIPAAFGLR